MRHLVTAGAVIGLSFLLLLPASATAQDAGPSLASLVRISGTRNGTPMGGSGFVVAVGRDVATIVTASHVIEGARFQVAFAASITDRFAVDRADILEMESGDPNGLAIFQVRGRLPQAVAALAFDAGSRLQAAESLLLVGFPQRSRTPLAKRRTYSGRRGNLLLLDLPVGEGFSGGPVLRGGKVAGVVTAEDLQLTYAVNAVVAREFVAGSGVAVDVQKPPVAATASEPAAGEGCQPGQESAFKGIRFVRICGGTFTMGSADGDEQATDDEMPQHEVTLSGLWIAKTETTNRQYRRLHPDYETGQADDLPAVDVSWNDATAFCEEYGFRLPAEAEWEYAARAGNRAAWSFGDDENDIEQYAWYQANSANRAHLVGTRKENAWGLHDMHGNVWEWVADWHGPYTGKPQTDPRGPDDGMFRVLRGGSFIDSPRFLRSANRHWDRPEFRFRDFGFRCARSPGRQPVAIGGQGPRAEPEPAASEAARSDSSPSRTASIAVAAIDSRGRADSNAAFDLVAGLLEAGYAATYLDLSEVALKALRRGRMPARLPAETHHVLVAELGEIVLADNDEPLPTKTARLDLNVKIFAAGGQLLTAFDADQNGAGFSDASAADLARRRAFEELVRQVRDRLP